MVIIVNNVNVCSIIILFGIVQGYYLAVILFRNSNGNSQANRYLGILLCAFSTSIFNIFLILTKQFDLYYHISKIPASITFLFGPLFLLYVRSLIDRTSHFERRDWFHFIPAFFVFVYYIPYYLADSSTKSAFVLSPSTHIDSFRFEHYEFLVTLICSQIHLWCYLGVVYCLLKQYQHKVKNYYSNIEQRNLSWIQFFITVIAAVYIIFFLLCIFLIKINYMFSYTALALSVSVSIFILGFRGLRQTEIITMEPAKIAAKPEPAELAGELVQSLETQLNELMIDEKLFTNPELNLDDLAKKLAVTRNTVSQYINNCLKVNFFDYINKFRVEEMKRLLLDPEKEYMTIYALAVEAGFNAKTTYNRIFKQYTGMTPTEFRQQHPANLKQ